MQSIGNTSISPAGKSWLARGGVIVAAILGLAIMLPAIYYAFLSALGLLGLGIAAGIGWVYIQSLGMLGQKLENKLLKMRKSEAAANPIEQIENNVMRRAAQLEAFKKGIEEIGAQILSLKGSLESQRKKDPENNFGEEIDALQKMAHFHEQKKLAYANALRAFDDYKKQLERAKFKFGFGNAAAGIAKAMNSKDAESLMQNMLSDEAFKSVDLRFNTAFAALDVESVELNTQHHMEFGKMTLDVEAIQIPMSGQLSGGKQANVLSASKEVV